MNIIYSYDPIFKGKIQDCVPTIHIVYVNEFNEASTKTFGADFYQALGSEQPVIPVVINSFGGSICELMAMKDIIDKSEKPVATIAIGKAMSCGSVLLSCGTPGYRYAAPGCRIMIHDASLRTGGKVHEVFSDAKELEHAQSDLFQTLDRNCNQKKGFFEKKLHEIHNSDWYLSAKEAKEYHLIDHVGLPEYRVHVSSNITFKNP